MLYPRSSPFRQVVNLSEFWDFRIDPDDQGEGAGWGEGFVDGRPIAVPASWNDQFEDWRDYLGPAWYQTRFDVPWGWEQQRIALRFGSVNYLADVWLNGVQLGQHEGGHLPFEFDVTQPVLPEGNLLVVRVDGRLAPDRVPPGNVPPDRRQVFPMTSCPSAAFDFFPFCGVHRPVLLTATPYEGIADLTVVTEIDGSDGLVRVRLDAGDAATARFALCGHGRDISVEAPALDEAVLRVPDAALWSPAAPNLYDLSVELTRDGEVFDRYTLRIGIRTIVVDGDDLLLNGEPIVLRGFGRH